jgi:hypothetical protein
MDIGKAFTFAFDDPDWLKKLGIGALLMIIPIFGWLVVAGWGIEITRRMITHDPQPLPDWNDFGGNFMKGLQVFVIGFVYMLPLIIVVGCPATLLGILAANTNSSDSNSIAGIMSVLNLCFGCIGVIYGILAGFVMPAAIGKFADTGQMGAAFRFGEVIKLVRVAPSAYLMVLVGMLLVSLLGNIIGTVICVVGVLITGVYSTAVNSHLFGQAYNVATSLSGGRSAY